MALMLILGTTLGIYLFTQRTAATSFLKPFEEDADVFAAQPIPQGDEHEYLDWEYWQSINPDVVGWIYVPNTPINYPVVQAQAENPSYYLYHDVYKNPSEYGVPYIDHTATPNSQAVIISGHNMGLDTEAMFGPLVRYSEYEYMIEHDDIIFMTPNSTRHILVRAAEQLSGSSATKPLGLENRADLAEWYQRRYEAAQTKGGPLDTEGLTQVFVFVTCSYGSYDERTLVYAVAVG
jgi:sortase B